MNDAVRLLRLACQRMFDGEEREQIRAFLHGYDREAAPQLGWQSIETAPEKEMFIYFQKREGHRMVGLAYRAKDGGWRDSEGNWSECLNPTHWMPLPEPPK